MEIIPVKYGDSFFFENCVTKNGDPKKRLDIVFQVYLIKLEDKLILVDAGCETMPGFEMSNFCGTIKALELKGIFPDEITDVIITHAHHDHIECVKYFKNAVVHIQKDEYESGKKFIPHGFNVNIFEEEYVLYDCIKIIKIGCHSVGSSIVECNIDGKEYVILGDECYLRRYFEKNAEIASMQGNEIYVKLYEKYVNEKYTILFSHDE